MAKAIQIEFPDEIGNFTLPEGVKRRLQFLLDKQDEGSPFSDEERLEAEALVSLSETLSLLRLRAPRLGEG